MSSTIQDKITLIFRREPTAETDRRQLTLMQEKKDVEG